MKPKSQETVNLMAPVGTILWTLWLVGIVAAGPATLESIPLPEHPRPDFARHDWQNLNGVWKFRFDRQDIGLSEKWFQKPASFGREIVVPFSWGSPLSCVADQADIAWYTRTVCVPESWAGKRVFLVIGACDWHTTAWIENKQIGSHRGGYTPFEFDLTPHIRAGQDQRIVLRVDDAARPFKLEGKQGYGPARGIWQTPYLEARAATFMKTLHFTPDIDAQKVTVRAELDQPAAEAMTLRLRFQTGNLEKEPMSQAIAPGAETVEFDVAVPNPRRWSLDDPFLYEVDAQLVDKDGGGDQVSSYFGMRKISVEKLPGTDYPYIALNGKPVYLQMALDQAYHPEGFYTFPSDAFMRDEILRSRQIGLNGMRIHVKVGIPRKLYWADRLGMLIMADVPNSWGQPTDKMKKETETALRGMIHRDFNHPSVFSWVIFNETWGLSTNDKGYTRPTQQWVASMYHLARSLDPTRLVEDNSANRKDHVVTDINSWHAYLPGYKWQEQLADFAEKTFPGSDWNFADGYQQGSQPQFNSECGNVWGYFKSTGDVDWSWDYHLMLNQFRRFPVTCGWLYTEHHDVINEWNGYYRYDRSVKFTGLSDLVDGMSLLDLHSLYYLSPGVDLCLEVARGATVRVPLWASVMCDFGESNKLAIVRTALYGWDTLGRNRTWNTAQQAITLKSWMSEEVSPLEIQMPNEAGLAVLAIWLEDSAGVTLHRNFTTFLVAGPEPARDLAADSVHGALRRLRIPPKDYSHAQWSLKHWNVFDGLKVNGAGSGFFEFRVPWPRDLDPAAIEDAMFVAELSAKQLFAKDLDDSVKMEGDYMRGKGTVDPSRNPNSYPMTDTIEFPSLVRIRVADQVVGVVHLPDDPADHRGILSWHAQVKDNQRREATLNEAGSYGYLSRVSIPASALSQAYKAKEIVVRLEVGDALPGGLAIHGKRFGRYPLDPTLVFRLRE